MLVRARRLLFARSGPEGYYMLGRGQEAVILQGQGQKAVIC